MAVSDVDHILLQQELASLKRKIRALNADIMDALVSIDDGSDAAACNAVITQRSVAIHKLLREFS